ncbi:Flagellar protein FlgJ-like protein [Asticcacaulis excentricus CB 48]|uniref:Flagellar protein FlgJ-like protein n=2 Tax=Asticcacaulis excentricus TaxID=78587 RepID=E8RNM9_ASTEC|nr:Flagellar protein FlgJ-like protein [Asticcacaulis excentricus CB 48]
MSAMDTNLSTTLDFKPLSVSATKARDPKAVGTDFENMVISQLLKPMFEGLTTDGMFGGGEGEEAFRSVYLDALAGQVVKSGGVGISAQVQKQLLALQEAHS